MTKSVLSQGAVHEAGTDLDHAAKADVQKPYGKKRFVLPRLKMGLPSQLLSLTVLFVLIAEFVIFLPSVSKFRTDWLYDRVQAAEIASIALEAAPDRKVSQGLSERLLRETQLLAVAIGDDDMWELVFRPQIPIASTPVTMDLRDESGLTSFLRTVEHATAKEGRILRVIAQTGSMEDKYMDIFVPEAALREDLLDYACNILLLSLFLSALIGALIAWSLYRLVVKPMMRITKAVVDFGDAPERLVSFKPSERLDEIGKAENALNDMQQTVSNAFRQTRRLAELGEAVAKISHDLRNSLSVARLASESLMRSSDPRVQSAAPRLERAIERAIGLAEATLRYGKAETQRAQMVYVGLRDAAEDALLEGLASTSEIDWLNEIEEDVLVHADPDMLHRLLANLVRNAGQAIADFEGMREPGLIRVDCKVSGDWLEIEVEDNGPGVPEHVQAKLFRPFSSSDKRGGTGLGLAITRELAQAMGGDVRLDKSTAAGAVFIVKLQHAKPKPEVLLGRSHS
ncbi:ATP-binding protein [Hirschia litorea]|uniref:histidine kinase n=1 Tax=Hirschia litorea TaxID=1199156 RepID=A0ABW2IJJ9_9PROT